MKLIIFARNNSAQLFNISADESETTDLAAMLPDVAQEMRARLEQLGREAVACWAGTGSMPNPPVRRPDLNVGISCPAIYVGQSSPHSQTQRFYRTIVLCL